MKLTNEEQAFFKDLAGSDTGRFIVNYMKRVQDHAYDSRSWKDGDSKESAAHAARLLQEFVIDRIRPKSSSGAMISDFE